MRTAGKADKRAASRQLGRGPRSLKDVGRRCPFGYPQVLVTDPVLRGDEDVDEIFPTLYWLSCPALNTEIGRLEDRGVISELQRRMRDDEKFRKDIERAHDRYAARRRELLDEEVLASLKEGSCGRIEVLARSGVGGIMNRSGLKCLHAHYADYLMWGRNPVGERVDELLKGVPLDGRVCRSRCENSSPVHWAVIDIGTNSTRLLICRPDVTGKLIELQRERVTTRIGAAVDDRGDITGEGMKRVREVLVFFKRRARELGADDFTVGATSAVRELNNRREFLETIRRETGLEVQVLSGRREAELSYLGAVRGLGFEAKAHVSVVDIGGGSTEIVSGRGDRPQRARSLRIGAVRALRNFGIPRETPLAGPELENTVSAIGARLKEHLGDFYKKRVSILAGVGGTITTFAAIELGLTEYDPQIIHGHTLNRERVNEILIELAGMDLEMRREIPGLQPERADIIVPGGIILCELMKVLKRKEIVVSESDLLFGLCYSRMKEVFSENEKETE